MKKLNFVGRCGSERVVIKNLKKRMCCVIKVDQKRTMIFIQARRKCIQEKRKRKREKATAAGWSRSFLKAMLGAVHK